jgi:hypothetical protein
MPKIDNVKRISPEEVGEESREAVEAVAQYYNYFAEQVTNALNGNLDFDNLKRSLLNIEVTLTTTNQPVTVTKFAGNVGLRGINVIRADNLTNAAVFPSSAPFITFGASGDGFYTILHITGLATLTKYRLVLELIY